MFAKHLTERFVQKMGRRVIGAHRFPPGMIDGKFKREPHAQFAFFDPSLMNKKTAKFLLGVADKKADSVRVHDARVANLAPRIRHKGAFDSR